MTARKNKADETQSKSAAKDEKSDDTRTASDKVAEDQKAAEQPSQTSDEAAQHEVPDSTQKFDDDEEVFEDDFVVSGEGVDDALGTVVERDRAGDAYEVPWTYLTADAIREGAKVRTSDSDDGDAVRWNAQWESSEREESEDGPVALVPVQGVPGQTFALRELPDPVVMEKAGIDPVQFLSGLPVRADVPDEEHRRGTPA